LMSVKIASINRLNIPEKYALYTVNLKKSRKYLMI